MDHSAPLDKFPRQEPGLGSEGPGVATFVSAPVLARGEARPSSDIIWLLESLRRKGSVARFHDSKDVRKTILYHMDASNSLPGEVEPRARISTTRESISYQHRIVIRPRKGKRGTESMSRACARYGPPLYIATASQDPFSSQSGEMPGPMPASSLATSALPAS